MTTHSERIYEQMVSQKKKALEIGMFCLANGITKADIFRIIDEKNDQAMRKEEEEKN